MNPENQQLLMDLATQASFAGIVILWMHRRVARVETAIGALVEVLRKKGIVDGKDDDDTNGKIKEVRRKSA